MTAGGWCRMLQAEPSLVRKACHSFQLLPFDRSVGSPIIRGGRAKRPASEKRGRTFAGRKETSGRIQQAKRAGRAKAEDCVQANFPRTLLSLRRRTSRLSSNLVNTTHTPTSFYHAWCARRPRGGLHQRLLIALEAIWCVEEHSLDGQAATAAVGQQGRVLDSDIARDARTVE